MKSAILLIYLAAATSCGPAGKSSPIPATVTIPAGSFVAGSDRAERTLAYRLDEAAYGHSVTRDQEWYENEMMRTERSLPAYEITQTLITNRHYAVFVNETGHPVPNVDPGIWHGYGLIHPYERTRRFAWKRDEDGSTRPPKGREDHPVVLVSHDDAVAYADWLSQTTGDRWRLPKQLEWEKAARGTDGRYFPWGNEFDPSKLNSHDAGPFDTVPVDTYPNGESPFGLIDPAGQVFEWMHEAAGPGRHWVRGAGSWDDKGCGICRPAAHHTRPDDLKHILIGFRLVRETEDAEQE